MILRYGLEYCDICFKRKAVQYLKVRKTILCSAECAQIQAQKCDAHIEQHAKKIAKYAATPAWIYTLVAPNGAIKYVGCTTNPASRKSSHKSKTAKRMGMNLTFVIVDKCTRANMFQLEAEWYNRLIAQNEPLEQHPATGSSGFSISDFEMADWVNYKNQLLSLTSDDCEIQPSEYWLDGMESGDLFSELKKAKALGFGANTLYAILTWHGVNDAWLRSQAMSDIPTQQRLLFKEATL